MELQDYARIWKRSWVLIVVITLVVTGLAAAWTLTRTPTYQAKSTVYVSVRTGDATVGDLQQGTTFARQSVASYVDIINTSIITEPVAEEVGGGLTAPEIASRLSASSPANTVLINITATDSDPALAAEIANTTSSVFGRVVTEQLEKPAEGSPARIQIDVVQPAEVPSAPTSPNAQRSLALGFLLGLMLGLGIAVLRSVLDVRINGKSDVRQVTEIPILGGIIRDPKASQRPLLVQDDPSSPRAEAFRQLRTNLQFLKVEGNPRSFVITSPGAAEGKSTTAANLAIALSETQASVILVDGDLRKPRIATLFGIEGGVGVTDVIIGKVTPTQAIQTWGRNGLRLLPAGRRAPNPSELLGSAEMESLLAQLSEHFDYVIVDAPPTLMVTDAAIISQSVGGALVVSAAGKTTRPQLQASLQSLTQIDARVLGIILTMLPEKGPDSYGYYNYSYGPTPHPEVATPARPAAAAPTGPGGREPMFPGPTEQPPQGERAPGRWPKLGSATPPVTAEDSSRPILDL